MRFEKKTGKGRYYAVKEITESIDQTFVPLNKHPCKNSNNWDFLVLIENLLCVEIATQISIESDIQLLSPVNSNT
jgi:hypothetical protein